MKKGRVAVPYIIAIIICVIVLALLLYMIFHFGRKEPLECSECAAKFTLWCAKCHLENAENENHCWDHGKGVDDELGECMGRCLGISPAPTTCNEIIRARCYEYGIPKFPECTP